MVQNMDVVPENMYSTKVRIINIINLELCCLRSGSFTREMMVIIYPSNNHNLIDLYWMPVVHTTSKDFVDFSLKGFARRLIAKGISVQGPLAIFNHKLVSMFQCWLDVECRTFRLRWHSNPTGNDLMCVVSCPRFSYLSC